MRKVTKKIPRRQTTTRSSSEEIGLEARTSYLSLFLIPLLGVYWFLLQFALKFNPIVIGNLDATSFLGSLSFDFSYSFLVFSITSFLIVFLRGIELISTATQKRNLQRFSEQLFPLSFLWFPFSLLVHILVESPFFITQIEFDIVRLYLPENVFDILYSATEIIGLLGMPVLFVFLLFRFGKWSLEKNINLKFIIVFLVMFFAGYYVYRVAVASSTQPLIANLTPETCSVSDKVITLDLQRYGLDYAAIESATLNGTLDGKEIYLEKDDGMHFIFLFNLTEKSFTVYPNAANKIEITYTRNFLDAILKRHSVMKVEFLCIDINPE